jgi:integrase
MTFDTRAEKWLAGYSKSRRQSSARHAKTHLKTIRAMLRQDGTTYRHVEQFCPTTEHVWQLYDAMPEHLRVAVLLGAFAGLRVSEAVALRTEDVDFIRGVVQPKVHWAKVHWAQDMGNPTSIACGTISLRC